jgi:RNA polymerase primary sigma factor
MNRYFNVDIMSIYFNDVEKEYKYINFEKQNILVKKAKSGDQLATEKLIKSLLKLVIHLAKKHHSREYLLSDLIQEGTLAIYGAIRNFNPDKGVKFSYYAAFWIKRYIIGYIKKQPEITQAIRLPEYILKHKRDLDKIITSFYKEHGRSPSEEEISRISGWSKELIKKIKNANRYAIRINVLNFHGDTNNPIAELITDTKFKDPFEDVELKNKREVIFQAMKVLSPKERTVLKMRFGFNTRPHALKEIGQKLGYTKEWVRCIQEKALKKIMKLPSSAKNLKEIY